MHKATNKFSLPQFYMFYVLLYVLYNINKYDVLQLTKIYIYDFHHPELNRAFCLNFSSCAEVYFSSLLAKKNEKEIRKNKKKNNLELEYSLSYHADSIFSSV